MKTVNGIATRTAPGWHSLSRLVGCLDTWSDGYRWLFNWLALTEQVGWLIGWMLGQTVTWLFENRVGWLVG